MEYITVAGKCARTRIIGPIPIRSDDENPADGKWRAWRGSERRTSKTRAADEVPTVRRYWSSKEWFTEAYQGTTIEQVWGIFDGRSTGGRNAGPCELWACRRLTSRETT
jgi:hypothetical protein